jgi:hypothetical protein
VSVKSISLPTPRQGVGPIALCAEGVRPYAALPHDLAADPRLSPTDVRVAAVLLCWARAKDHCWPSDGSIGAKVGRSAGTVQRALRSLEAAG